MNKKFYARIATDIRKMGRSIIGVFSCPDDPLPFGFAYTIGNAAQGLPELLVIGTTDGGFLNVLSQKMIDAGAAFANGELVLIPHARAPVKVIEASAVARDEYTIQAGQYFGTEDYSIMQVLIPDRAGRFPGEAGCAAPFSTVPVLRLS
jgi:hypothetical protein